VPGGRTADDTDRLPARPQPPAQDPLPRRGESQPPAWDPLPRRTTEPPAAPAAAQSQPLPRRGDSQPPAQDPLPRRGDQQPQNPLPRRADPPEPGSEGGEALPRRTTRTRRAGRHRSPHRLSVASDAPALVLAVPGTAAADQQGVAEEIAATAELSCPGVDIRIGYLAGEAHSLADALTFDSRPDPHAVAGVVVPLLAGPFPAIDDRLARAVSEASAPVLLAAHLGPHPLVAESLHARLADAGLARHARAHGLSIATAGHGVLVLADGGVEAVQTAEVAAVLLASRLSIPTVTALLGDSAAISRGLGRLREAGSQRATFAPCVIGPETPRHELDSLTAQFGIPCAAPLGAHPAVAQLVAIRYGAALARLSMAGSPG
jgi:hypothetical protein